MVLDVDGVNHFRATRTKKLVVEEKCKWRRLKKQ